MKKIREELVSDLKTIVEDLRRENAEGLRRQPSELCVFLGIAEAIIDGSGLVSPELFLQAYWKAVEAERLKEPESTPYLVGKIASEIGLEFFNSKNPVRHR